MGPTDWFLTLWLAAVGIWEFVALGDATDSIEPISAVLSRLPIWAIVIIMCVWVTLWVHVFTYARVPAYRNFLTH